MNLQMPIASPGFHRNRCTISRNQDWSALAVPFHAMGHSAAVGHHARPALRRLFFVRVLYQTGLGFGQLADRTARAALSLRPDRPPGTGFDWVVSCAPLLLRTARPRVGVRLSRLRAMAETDGYDESMTATETLVESIDERLRELNDEIRTLTAARGALEGREASEVKRRPRSTASRVSRRDNSTGAEVSAQSANKAVAAASSEISPRAPQEPKVGARSKRGRKRSSVDVVAAGRLEALLSENREMTTSALAERVNANREQVLNALHELEAAGRVRRSGQRGSTRWHAITDEERIEARAAELAARSTTAVSRVRARV